MRNVECIPSSPGKDTAFELDEMENANPVESRDKRQTEKRQKKKPYTKPTFRYERVFETSALSCGKVYAHQSTCHSARKTS